MRVTGPDWPSTRALAEALKDVQGPDLRWGQGGKNATEQLKAFQESGLACPEFTTDLNTAKGWVKVGYRVFGRRLHHTQGADIIGAGYHPAKIGGGTIRELQWITTKKGNRVQRIREKHGVVGQPEQWNKEWLQRDFWVKVIDSTNEYRQHIWDGRAIRIGKKVEAGEHHRIQPVRSRNNGWHIDYGFKPNDDTFSERIRALAKSAVSSLGYIGGAVDILEGRDNRLYVLEVNSAPALTDTNTLGAYKQAIERWVKREAKKPKADPRH